MFKKLLGTLAVRNKQEKERNANRTGEREITFVCYNMILYKKKKLKLHQRLLKLVDEFKKITANKINIQKLVTL